MPNSPHGVSYDSYRPVVMGRNGMVCSGHPLASQAGIASCSGAATLPTRPWPRRRP